MLCTPLEDTGHAAQICARWIITLPSWKPPLVCHNPACWQTNPSETDVTVVTFVHEGVTIAQIVVIVTSRWLECTMTISRRWRQIVRKLGCVFAATSISNAVHSRGKIGRHENN